jgi:hypothetical protein
VSAPTTRRLLDDEAGGFVLWWLIGMSGVAILVFALVADGSRVMADLNESSYVSRWPPVPAPGW